MASIHKEVEIEVPADHAWAAFRDVGRVHERLVRGFVVDTRLDDDARVVTFANGAVVRERIVDIDDAARRLAYAIVGWRATHHNASFQVFAEHEKRSRIVWVADVLPNEVVGLVESMMEQGCRAIKRTLEHDARHQPTSV
jgi:hypothetical protein